MLRRNKKTAEPKQRKGFAFNPSVTLFKRKFSLSVDFRWEKLTQE